MASLFSVCGVRCMGGITTSFSCTVKQQSTQLRRPKQICDCSIKFSSTLSSIISHIPIIHQLDFSPSQHRTPSKMLMIFNMRSYVFQAAALLLLLFTPGILCSSTGVGLAHHQALDDHMEDEPSNKVRDCINAIIRFIFHAGKIPTPRTLLWHPMSHIPVLLSLRDLPCIHSSVVHDNDGEYGGVLASSSSYIFRER